MQRLAREANEILTQENGRGFDVLPMPEFEDLYGSGGDEQLVSMGHVDANNTLIMLHSSGMLVLCCLLRDQELLICGMQALLHFLSPSESPTGISGLNGAMSLVRTAQNDLHEYYRLISTAAHGELDVCGMRLGVQTNPIFRECISCTAI